MNEEQKIIEGFAAFLHENALSDAWEDIDWKQFESVALQNKVAPLLFKHIIKNHPDHFPAAIWEKFESYYSANAHAALRAGARLLHVLHVLEANNIQAIPFKGLMLAEQVYGDIGLRNQGDMDLLVDEEDALRAVQLLKDIGYTSPYHLQAKSFKAYCASRGSIELNSIHGTGVIDLHWELTNRYATIPYDLTWVLKDSKKINILNRPVPALADEDLIIVLCFHGAKDQWNTLERLLCLAYFVHHHPGINWEQLMAKAARMRGKQVVLFGLFLAQHLMGIRLPEPISREIACRKQIFQSMYRDNVERKKSSGRRSATRFSHFHFQLRDNWKDRCLYFFHLLIHPSSVEWGRMPLPSSLTWSYIVIRPIRIVVMFFKNRV